MSRLFALLLLVIALTPLAQADNHHQAALTQLLRLAGVDPGSPGPDRRELDASPTRHQQLPSFRAVMEEPLSAPSRARSLAAAYRAVLGSPGAMIGLTAALAGVSLERSAAFSTGAPAVELVAASDPLAASLRWMAPMAAVGSEWPPALPDAVEFPSPLRLEVALVLAALSQSHQLLEQALARVPAGLTPALLRRQAFEGRVLPSQAADYRHALELVDWRALYTGMLVLVESVDRLKRYVATAAYLPAVDWQLDTPLGRVVVDTTGRDNHHRLKDPLLVLDVGGDDSYEFDERSETHRISVVLDHKGNDRYVADAPGADPSSATLGYGLLWDTEGDDRYQGTQHAQASALFGAALLVDGGGNNEFIASSHSQAQAIAGIALLLVGSGNDRYTAQTFSQASAGPRAVAALIDIAGDDRYTLNNTPLVAPSPQLPERNTSMGQGAGYGIRPTGADGPSAAGGMGMLLDFAGNDRYTAQVFAQGAGYHEGLGILVDEGGSDRFDAAWYAMGAAAHHAAGVLVKRGAGDDVYRASHTISLGAAHDFSVGIFMDEGGNDDYRLGDLGLGAAHDHSTALFVDGAGDDRYKVDAAACRALGFSQLSDDRSTRQNLPNLGLFLDLGGADHYPAHCRGAGNDTSWTAPRSRLGGPSSGETGAGLDLSGASR